MPDNLFCEDQKRITRGYKDGWTRSFVGHPEMNDDIKEMLHEHIKEGDAKRVLIFFHSFCDYDEEYSLFLLRELENGYL